MDEIFKFDNKLLLPRVLNICFLGRFKLNCELFNSILSCGACFVLFLVFFANSFKKKLISLSTVHARPSNLYLGRKGCISNPADKLN